MKYSVRKWKDGYGVEDEVGMRLCVCHYEVEAGLIAAALNFAEHREEIERVLLLSASQLRATGSWAMPDLIDALLKKLKGDVPNG